MLLLPSVSLWVSQCVSCALDAESISQMQRKSTVEVLLRDRYEAKLLHICTASCFFFSVHHLDWLNLAQVWYKTCTSLRSNFCRFSKVRCADQTWIPHSANTCQELNVRLFQLLMPVSGFGFGFEGVGWGQEWGWAVWQSCWMIAGHFPQTSGCKNWHCHLNYSHRWPFPGVTQWQWSRNLTCCCLTPSGIVRFVTLRMAAGCSRGFVCVWLIAGWAQVLGSSVSSEWLSLPPTSSFWFLSSHCLSKEPPLHWSLLASPHCLRFLYVSVSLITMGRSSVLDMWVHDGHIFLLPPLPRDASWIRFSHNLTFIASFLFLSNL